MRYSTSLLLTTVCFLPLAAGCSEGSSLRIWTSRQGGVVRDFHQPRVDRVAAAIAQSEVGHPLAVQVLDSADPAAFSWPSGEVFVTRRLVDLLDDDELGAAIAHEMGHLLGDGFLKDSREKSIAALRGCCKDLDAESRADAIGAKLLHAHGLCAQSMARMLEKVRGSASLTDDSRSAIGQRIELLRAGSP